MRERKFGLADCNNFFVSCERRVDPTLEGKPVIVLSNNDGCVISRSNEAKRLGIKMCDPYFKIKNMLAANNVEVRSSNMRLYRQISAEVMGCLEKWTDTTEMYSIDEAFFNMAICSVSNPVAYGLSVRKDILEKCRIPVSIGIAPTKTLAKLGTEYAKSAPETGGVFWVSAEYYKDTSFMSQFDCIDIWGIGRRTAEKLRQLKVRSAADFTAKDDAWTKKRFGISAMYCAWELRGQPVYSLSSAVRPPKSIMVSRSFGEPLLTFSQLLEPLCCFAASAARQLRESKQTASKMTIFIATSRFVDEERRYDKTAAIQLEAKRYSDADFINLTKETLREIFISGYQYKRAGIILTGLSSAAFSDQTGLFDEESDGRTEAVSHTVDELNRIGNLSIIKPAALFSPPDAKCEWKPRSQFQSNAKPDSEAQQKRLRFQCHADDYRD